MGEQITVQGEEGKARKEREGGGEGKEGEGMRNERFMVGRGEEVSKEEEGREGKKRGNREGRKSETIAKKGI